MSKKKPAPAPAEDAGPIVIDAYEPDYNTPCGNCDQTPTVTGVKDGKTVLHMGMCGPCVWGEARTIDPSTWNE